ncbi:hypothetical protein THAOC_18132, partial [Thalassiosira oceanica]
RAGRGARASGGRSEMVPRGGEGRGRRREGRGRRQGGRGRRQATKRGVSSLAGVPLPYLVEESSSSMSGPPSCRSAVVGPERRRGRHDPVRPTPPASIRDRPDEVLRPLRGRDRRGENGPVSQLASSQASRPAPPR